MAFDLDEEELRATRKMNKADRDEIEVNEYVRTKNGVIDKVESYSIGCCVWHCKNGMCIDKCNCIGTHLEEIVKHSKQLIDLIEVTDIIKYRINNISTTLETKGYIEGIVDISDKEMLQRIKNDKNYEILEILTHEQYEQNSNKVGGE